MSTFFFPDPALTANIYCTGRLDAVIFRIVAPFWRELRAHDCEGLCSLWLMRYGKGGEHLKVRVHGPESLRPLLRELLEKRATAFLSSLPEPAERPRTASPEGTPAIDAEDEIAGDHHPDHTLLWTTYKRSHISLGGKPFLSDNHYVALLTRCLAAGCERVLSLEEPDTQDLLPRQVRQNSLLKALIAGLAALGFSSEKRADYLVYHSDWLLRFLLPRDQRSEAKAVEQLRQHLDSRMAGMAASLLPLRRAAEVEWNKDRALRPRDGGLDAGWRRSLADLLAYVSPLCHSPEYRLDPFASDPVFAPTFKVFHGLANQLGLRHSDEAFAHHVLWQITTS